MLLSQKACEYGASYHCTVFFYYLNIFFAYFWASIPSLDEMITCLVSASFHHLVSFRVFSQSTY